MGFTGFMVYLMYQMSLPMTIVAMAGTAPPANSSDNLTDVCPASNQDSDSVVVVSSTLECTQYMYCLSLQVRNHSFLPFRPPSPKVGRKSEPRFQKRHMNGNVSWVVRNEARCWWVTHTLHNTVSHTNHVCSSLKYTSRHYHDLLCRLGYNKFINIL